MGTEKETVVLGAGLAGMVASIILAREGREVRVLESAKGLGGNSPFHPSLHATPIDMDKVAAWTGLDTNRMFTLGNVSETFIGTQVFYQKPMYIVERGNRSTAIDTYLFEEAEKLGVAFEFGHHVKDPKELPKGSIIATGYHPSMYKAFNMPCAKGEGYNLIAENDDPSLEGNVYSWIAPYTKDYAYGCVLNGMRYLLLFSRFSMPKEALDQFQKDLKATLGWEHDNWGAIRNHPYPWTFKRPKLLVDGYILAGAAGNNIDPMGGFGIHGAILSGVIAARAVSSPEKAAEELKRLNKRFTVAALTFESLKRMPASARFYRIVLSYPELFGPMMFLMGRGIPGYDRNWCTEVINGYHKGRGLGERLSDMKKIFTY
jgi:flavin-dependent dehydrogenase